MTVTERQAHIHAHADVVLMAMKHKLRREKPSIFFYFSMISGDPSEWRRVSMRGRHVQPTATGHGTTMGRYGSHDS